MYIIILISRHDPQAGTLRQMAKNEEDRKRLDRQKGITVSNSLLLLEYNLDHDYRFIEDVYLT